VQDEAVDHRGATGEAGRTPYVEERGAVVREQWIREVAARVAVQAARVVAVEIAAENGGAGVAVTRLPGTLRAAALGAGKAAIERGAVVEPEEWLVVMAYGQVSTRQSP
jgi:hypothetical protein